MPAYFDSSVLVSLLIGDRQASRARELWHGEMERVSSILLDVECTTVLRRLQQTGARAGADSPEQRLVLALEEVTLKPLDEDVVEVVRSTSELAGCRTLDAVHVATALYFHAIDADLHICTFDARMADVAARAGLAVRGAS